jgi:hypothetical protein
VTATPEALDVGATVPHAAPKQPVPDKDQVTPLFELSLATVAVNDWLCPTCTGEVGGATVTETGALRASCCGGDPPPQPLSKAMATIANKNPGVRPTCVCVNAGLPSSYFRLARFWIRGWKFSLMFEAFWSRGPYHTVIAYRALY